MSISIISTVGTDTGSSNYSTSGTVTNSANITTAVGDVVFVWFSYAPGTFSPIVTTFSGGTGSYTSYTAIQTDGNVVSQSFYKIATAAETYKVTTTLATNASNRRITVVVIRSTTGSLAFSTGSGFSQVFSPPAVSPSVNSLTAKSVPDNSIIILGISSQNATSWTAGSGYTLLSTSDPDVAEYQTNTTATSTTPSFLNGATGSRIRAGGFVFYEAITYTYSRPSSDVTTQWTPSTPGAAHYTMINETTPNDTNYIYSTAAGQTDEVGLQAMSTPVAGTSLTINYRVIGVTGTGASVTTSLYSGATLVKADTARTTDGTYAMTVTSAEWASVSNWSNMRLRFVSA